MYRAANRGLGLLLLITLLSACATMTGEYDPPKVTVESFRSLPGEGATPQFEIGLRIANPNKQALDVAGIAYDIEIMGKDLVSGVSNEVPRIEGYAEESVTLTASFNWLAMIRLITSLPQQAPEELDYRFKAKIDFNGFVPTQRVEESGSFTLNPPSK